MTRERRESGRTADPSPRNPQPRSAPREHARRDLVTLLLLAAVVLSAGIGLRDPWPADEPRFALVGTQMVESGEWLFPHRGAELYADKPPVFFWLIAAAYVATGSLRIAFLLPSLLAGLATLVLVHDLARRLWGRRAAWWAGLALLACVQFTLQARTAQIDMVLAAFTTLALYGFARHLLLGPAWRWWYVAFAACGAGVITKGVGFLPLLVLLPWAVLRRRGWRGVPRFPFPLRHAVLGPVAMIGVILAWLVPVLVAASGDPQLAAYRDNILLRQTATRYVAAWHHHRWVGYFLLNVAPWAWLPLTGALPWLVPAWRRRFGRRHAAPALFLAWVVLVLVFFSASPGKRGVYILPALPALVLAAAPLLPGLTRLPGPRRAAWASTIAAGLVLLGLATWISVWTPARIAAVLEGNEFNVGGVVAPVAALGLAALALSALGRRRGVAALGAFIGCAWLVVGWWVYPSINELRYPGRFMAEVGARIGPAAELGQVAWREQFMLAADRPLVTFGYGRTDGADEAREAAAWLAAGRDRWLLVPEEELAPCFDLAKAERLGQRHGRVWYLAGPGSVTGACVATAGAAE